jgi:ribosomal protein S18 acetylase RimI-like enzyme
MTMMPNFIWVTWMESTTPPLNVPALPTGLTCTCTKMTTSEYLRLYLQIGGPVNWDLRLLMPENELDAVLRAVSNRCYLLADETGLVGLCEFDLAASSGVELQHFGLIPRAQGKGLGSIFLQTALRSVFAEGAKRIWLHTDEEDSPAAKKMYERAGFKVYDRKFMDPTPL